MSANGSLYRDLDKPEQTLLAEAKSAPSADSTKRAFTDLTARVSAAPARAAIDASAKTALAGTNAKAMIDGRRSDSGADFISAVFVPNRDG